jgi:hypothetical protein
MKAFRRMAVVVCVLGLALGVVALPGQAGDGDLKKDLAAARRATAKYHNVSVAEAAGYTGAGEDCVALPSGAAMGYHFVNFALLQDPSVDVEEPEILLYAPSGNGLRLVGLEYWVADADQNLATDADRPVLFGRGFDGPMPGHVPGMPVHYDIHVWVWQSNPDGMFAPFNPNLDCEA